MENTTYQPTPSQITRARRMLDQLIISKQMSPEALKWLAFALDPFHDREIKGVEGIPDGNTGKSVVCSVVQELNIKKPAGLTPGANWSCRVVTYPVASHQNLANSKVYGNLVNNVDNGPNLIAPVVIDYQNDGVDFNEFSTGGDYLEIPAAFTKGPYKIGAMGVEVINTTSDLNRQGLVTCARMNQTGCEPATSQIFNNSTALYTFADLMPIRTAPINLAQMTLLTGNTGWKAAEGAYSVVALKSLNDRNAQSKPVYPMLLSDDFQSGAPTTINGAAPIVALAPVPGLAIPGNPNLLSITGFPGVIPMDSSVIMFTGLSEATTLTVRARWMIERFPNDIEAEIVVLASETAHYDPVALSIYSQVMQALPAAVEFKENPQGEWWKQVLGAIADVVGTGLMMIPHPVAKTAGGALLVANKALNPGNATMKVSKAGGPPVERSASKKARKKNKGRPPASGTVKA